VDVFFILVFVLRQFPLHIVQVVSDLHGTTKTFQIDVGMGKSFPLESPIMLHQAAVDLFLVLGCAQEISVEMVAQGHQHIERISAGHVQLEPAIRVAEFLCPHCRIGLQCDVVTVFEAPPQDATC